MVHSEPGTWFIVCLPHFKLVIKCQFVLLSANRGPLKVKGLLPIRTRQPARALQNTSRLRPLLITQPGWAYTSVTDYPYARRQPLSHACSSLISSHAYGLCIAGRNSSTTAFTLSSPAVAAAIGQIRRCFLPGN
jgi:hypothetical protein